jgi:hypothetical protein
VPTGFEVVWARRWDIDPCDAHVAASDSSGLFPMDWLRHGIQGMLVWHPLIG